MMLPNGFCDEANQVFRLKMAYATFRMFPADGLRYAAGCEGDALERIVELRFGITFMQEVSCQLHAFYQCAFQ